jgi:hypothetical protein
MLYQSALITAASGSTGGLTASHNRGGMYFRGRAIPTNPNTERQQAVREDVGQLSNAWNNQLTQAQRNSWNLYANNVPVINALGATVHISGFNHYVRSNQPRLQAGLARVDAAPTTFTLGATPLLDNYTVANDNTFTLLGTIPAPTVITDRLLAWIGRPVSPGRSFFRGPYRFAGSEAFDLVGAAEFASITTPFAMTLGQRIFVRARVTLTDGRLSAEAQATVLVTVP